MKKLILINLLLLSLSFYGQAEWTLINTNTTNHLRDIVFTGPAQGYIIGDNGTILKTIDAGSNWFSIFQGATHSFVAMSFINENLGYVMTSNTLFKTVNGGGSWAVQYVSANSNLNTVKFITENIGFIGAENGIYKTGNGGVSWDLYETANAVKSISFPTQDTGYFTGGTAVSDYVYKTTNQGNTYVPQTLLMQSVKERVFFINQITGYIIGWYSPMIKKTVNGGITWENVYNSLENAEGGMEIHFVDEMNGFRVDNGTFSKIYNTIDGGNTWQEELSISLGNSTYGLTKMTFINDIGYIVGQNGILYKRDPVLSISNVKKNENNIIVYPNPYCDEINLKYDAERLKIIKISINDASGKTIKTIHSGFTGISMQKFAAGTYFLLIYTDKGNHTKKIVKN
jgi:photosystem II stability/assembly factor-like uncharacterized protein